MSYDDDWPDQTWENRRMMIKKMIHPITRAELEQLGGLRFSVVTDPRGLKMLREIVDTLRFS